MPRLLIKSWRIEVRLFGLMCALSKHLLIIACFVWYEKCEIIKRMVECSDQIEGVTVSTAQMYRSSYWFILAYPTRDTDLVWRDDKHWSKNMSGDQIWKKVSILRPH